MTGKQRSGEFTGRHMLMAMVAFFGVIIGVNLLMAVVSSSTWTGLVVANSYVASQQFQEREGAARRQRARGWTAQVAHAGNAMRLVVTDGTGRPVALGEVRLLVHRPVGGREDQTLVLVPQADGSYAADVVLVPGVWDVVVTASETVAGPFELRDRLVVGRTP